jgi:hypothetical protein
MLGVSQDELNSEELNEEVKPPLLPVHVRGPTLPSPAFTYYLRKRKRRYGFSTASLNNIATIHVRKKPVLSRTLRGSWCVGLRIVHHDSSIDILGRWDPRDKSSISRIYDTTKGFLTRLSFHLTTFTKATFVENITIEVKDTLREVQSLDASLFVPIEPPEHRWNCKSGQHPRSFKNTRVFDCTQDSQVRDYNSTLALTASRLLMSSLQRVAWWFTSRSDDISRDHGSPMVQAEEIRFDTRHSLEEIQVDCDGMAV